MKNENLMAFMGVASMILLALMLLRDAIFAYMYLFVS